VRDRSRCVARIQGRCVQVAPCVSAGRPVLTTENVALFASDPDRCSPSSASALYRHSQRVRIFPNGADVRLLSSSASTSITATELHIPGHYMFRSAECPNHRRSPAC